MMHARAVSKSPFQSRLAESMFDCMRPRHRSGLCCNDKPNAFLIYKQNLASDAAHASEVKMLSQKLHDIVAAQYL